jgi:hypothetical protein
VPPAPVAFVPKVDLPNGLERLLAPPYVPTFPATMPLAAAAFVAMLQLTLVGEGWPLRGLPRLPAGPLALAISWAVAVAVYFALADVRRELGTVLIVIGAWQALFYVACTRRSPDGAAALTPEPRRRPCS